jgi:hypothetical protein
MTSASALEHRSRYELVEEARALGVERPERMTMQELKDEILRLTLSEEEQVGARGLFGVARAMLASVVEAGLKMPDAAKVIRGDVTLDLPVRSRSPVATVTLAEIYAAQGHRARALAVLDEVLAIEPDHEEARRIQRELTSPDTSAAEAASARSAAAPPLPEESSPLRRSGAPSEIGAPATPAAGRVEAPGEFPSTEYVPIEVVETTGHEVALTPAPTPVSSRPVDPPAEPPSDPLGVPSEPPPAVNLWLDPPPPPLESTAEPVEVPPAVDLWQAPPPPLESTQPVENTPSYDPFVSPPPLASPAVPLATEPLLATEQRGATLCLYWELPPEVVARSGLTESEGEPAVAVVAFTPAGPQPLRDQRTLPLDWRVPFAGCLVVPGLGPSAAVRAAVGWVVEGTFLPLAVGRTLERLTVDAPAVAARARKALEQLDV